VLVNKSKFNITENTTTYTFARLQTVVLRLSIIFDPEAEGIRRGSFSSGLGVMPRPSRN
jgi:hypothetical protein